MPDFTHLQQIRQEMPATTAHIYLNAGTFGPLPACVINAIQERMQYEWQNGRLGAAGFESISSISVDARKGAAHLLNVDVDEIALTDNTGEGLNIISYGIDWHEGDEVITTNHEHISLLGPLYQLRERYGIVIRIADIGEKGDLPVLKSVTDLVTPRTRLISLSHVSWMTGAVLNISEVGYLGREWGIPVLIDGAQSAGAIPLDMHALNIDFYAIPMQKWLCGPDGTGALYARREALGYTTPTYVGYWSIKHEEGSDWQLHDTAQRFEVGGRQTAALAGQAAVLNWLEQVVGFQWIHKRIATLSAYAYHSLQELPGLLMLTPRAGESGLVSFRLEGKDDTEMVNYLREKHNIYIRNIHSTHALRISTGFYNTEEEIDTLVRALREM
ncbi:MAG TPA: aminotransferase class V-fold PLP-dependent enzyme [Ktedonobacteraceae bacterium]|nr:aminotransferase class V-fold PLP-dependent enzyme [Ktedonobacteraceae bacterium]